MHNTQLRLSFFLKQIYDYHPWTILENDAHLVLLEKNKVQVNLARYMSLQMDYRVAQKLLCLKYSNQDKKAIRQALQDPFYLKGAAIN